MPVTGNAQIGVMGRSLNITVPGRRWAIAIQRIDGASDAAFAPHHAQQITEVDIKAFIPNWQNLNWTHHAPPIPGLPRESRAEDNPYRIYLIYAMGNVPQPQDIVDEFQADIT